MFRIAVVAAVVSLGFIASDGVRPDAHAAFPGTNGRIAYQDTFGDGQIWVMNANGSDKTQVTSISGPARDPTWTADRTHLYYYSDTQVRRVEVDGVDDDGVSGTDGGTSPTVSPDGTRIAYDLNRDIVASNPPMNLTQTPLPVQEYEPDWSPDGESIVFARQENNNYDLFIVPATGGTPINLTNTPDIAESSPDWSPDGQRIIFDISPATGTESFVRIAAIGIDGENYEELTSGDADLDPVWSPDGEFFVFYQRVVQAGVLAPQGADPSNIIVADADGDNQHSISGAGTHFHVAPDWGVDEPFVAPDLIWGDVNCDGNIDASDALFWLTDNAGIVGTPNGCPAINDELQTQSFGDLRWGNLDCSEGLDTEDVMLLLKHEADLPPANLQNCPALGVFIQQQQ